MLYHDPAWPRAHDWLASQGEDPSVEILGLPINRSISPGNCHLAPGAIREALAYLTPNTLEDVGVRDLGDLSSEQAEDFAAFPDRRAVRVFLGGDNAVTYFGVKSLGLPLDRIAVITTDAHLDMRLMPNGLNNGSPIRALIESGLPGKQIFQIGILPFANSGDYFGYARENGSTQISAREVHEIGAAPTVQKVLANVPDFVEAIYVDFDIDVLDRAFCPGAPGARPGGLMPDQLFQIAEFLGQHPKVVAADIVEFDPNLDINRQTGLACASLLLHFIQGVASRP